MWFGCECTSLTLALAVPILLYGNEIWIIRKKGKKAIDINQDGFFLEEEPGTPFLTAK